MKNRSRQLTRRLPKKMSKNINYNNSTTSIALTAKNIKAESRIDSTFLYKSILKAELNRNSNKGGYARRGTRGRQNGSLMI